MKKTWLLVLSFFISLPFYGQQEWKQTIVDNSLTISTPFEIHSLDLGLDEETQKKLDKYITFSGQDSLQTFMVMVISALYKPPITTNVSGALNGSIDNLKGSGKNTVQYEQHSLNDFGIEGISVIGQIEDNTSGEKSFIYGYYYGKDNKYWNILILFFTDNQENRDKALKVYQSIRITGN